MINVPKELWDKLHKLEQDAIAQGDADAMVDIRMRKDALADEILGVKGKGVAAVIPNAQPVDMGDIRAAMEGMDHELV